MEALGDATSPRKFEEVNERLTCCSYLASAGSFPPYCRAYGTPDFLDAYCETQNLYPAFPTPRLDGRTYLAEPIRVTLRVQQGMWRVTNRKRLAADWFTAQDIRGDDARLGVSMLRARTGADSGCGSKARSSRRLQRLTALTCHRRPTAGSMCARSWRA